MWFTPEDWAEIQAQQVHEDSRLVKSTPTPKRCSGCGQFMELNGDAYLMAAGMHSHLTMRCVDAVLIKLVKQYPHIQLHKEEPDEE